MRVRRLGPGEEDVLRAVRLQALADSPAAFCSTYEGEVGRSLDEWTGWITTGATFVVEPDVGEEPVGLVTAQPDRDGERVLWVLSMWLHPKARGSGAADALMRAVLVWAAAEGWPVLRLHVIEGNVVAHRVYERHGFRLTGRRFLRPGDGRVEVEMDRP